MAWILAYYGCFVQSNYQFFQHRYHCLVYAYCCSINRCWGIVYWYQFLCCGYPFRIQACRCIIKWYGYSQYRYWSIRKWYTFLFYQYGCSINRYRFTKYNKWMTIKVRTPLINLNESNHSFLALMTEGY